MRLHGADWNDALDMAWDKGESVAFTCAYAGNLLDIAKCLRNVEKISGINRIEVLDELKLLLADDEILYNCPDKKQELLMSYAKACENCTSGGTVLVPIAAICENLEHKAEWMMKNIRENEWISDGTDGGWFNGYYDNNGRPVERCESGDVRMMLTGQVFAIMSGTAKKEQIKAICNSADKYLFDQNAGGYRLNTDFKEEKFDLGRMFGFAYGEKENGAVFSHMAVMYANALYKQGFIKEGYKVLKTLLDTAMDFDRSRMYPGVPEYFDNDGRGLYSYLTGAASWYMLTMITSVYGVHGELGDLVIEPVLMPQQYNEKGDAKVSSFKDITKADTIALGDPKSVPAGQYAQEILTNLKNWNDVKKKASFGTNVTEVLNWVAKGSASCGVVYATDAASNKDVKVLAEAPADALKTPVIYPVAALKKSKNKDAADKFVKFLQSEKALKVFRSYGFTINK